MTGHGTYEAVAPVGSLPAPAVRANEEVTDALIDSLSRRLFAASNVLTRLAEKDGSAKEVMRLRLALERIAALGGEVGHMAREALGW